MIINASPLIIFGKLNKIGILKKMYPALKITRCVYEEVVVKGIEKNATDAFIIKEHIKNKDISIRSLTNKFNSIANKIRLIYNIDLGEAETIALAKQLDKKQIIIDEIAAREAAKALGIRPIGSLRVLLLAYKGKLISKSEIKRLIIDMENSKYRFSPNVLIEFWALLEKIKR